MSSLHIWASPSLLEVVLSFDGDLPHPSTTIIELRFRTTQYFKQSISVDPISFEIYALF